ncbi:DNA gyrase subunit A [Hypericibacter adhaerens]|uniref:DNA gyrase subunit A n=2 Tax=Hypericibacter adhaerens TaxID=2602016 RepID=A0A5J6MWX4_9PROT|nr:DNA gyrase subunit A [Hypericibacter adhaerens]QEX22158.1 DNA gyrase subunit A [Hypericibacter adhaerens]
MTQPPASEPLDITPVTIEEEMKRSYLEYAMSVIVARALPDVRDGLKPVHRRILYAMKEGGYDFNRPFRKSARIVGEVMGKYHPHGDAAIYDAMVRMAQDFSMRLPLIDSQGNFGSMDGDPPAAMRYTEARLARAASALLDDIDKETVPFQPNYDGAELEPSVLPARFPNLLINGANGIAVGMATNIPPHNLGEVVDGCIAYIDNPAIAIEDLIAHIPGPDFPTGGVILGKSGIREAFHLGRGSIQVRARSHVEEIRKDREAIVVSEIPYQVNKSRLLERIAECVREKIIEGIADLRDESDRDGVRVVIELKRDAMAEVVLNQLYRHTPLQTSFGVNMLAINGGRPELLNLKQIIAAFVTFREEVITKRAVFDLRKTRERAHILVGLAIAVANIDEVIDLIRKAPDPNTARDRLMARAWPAQDVAPLIRLIDEPGRTVAEDGTYRLSEEQAKAILELRLQRLTGLEREKIADEIKEIAAQIVDLLDILGSRARRLTILRTELLEMKAQFATPRRTTLEELEFEQDVEDLIQREDMVVTVTHGGYIKRVPLSAFRAQRRGGKGRAAMATRDEDFVTQLFVADTHTPMLLFSTRGMVYKTKVYKLPLGTPQARGRALVNLLPLEEGETISTVMPLPEDEARWSDMFVMFATSSGYVRRNRLSDFTSVMANGKIAMKLEEPGELLIGVQTCAETDDVLLAGRGGRSIRFAVADVRVFTGRTSTGVRGIKLGEGDRVVSMSILGHVEADTAEREAYLRWSNARRRQPGEEPENGAAEAAAPEAVAEEGEAAPGAAEAIELSADRLQAMEAAEEFILTITEKGYGKRSSAYEYRITGRGGQGIVNIAVGERNGPVAATFPVGHGDQIMLVTDRGQLIRCPVGDIRIAGRNTQGVIVFKVSDGERVVSVTRLGELGDSAEGGPDGAGSNGVDEAPAGDGIGGEADGDAGAGETGPAIKE